MIEHDETKTMPIVAAGKKYFGLGQSASYRAAKIGDLPTVRIGSKTFVSVPAIERMLLEAGKDSRE